MGALAVCAAPDKDAKQRMKTVRELAKGGSAAIPQLQAYFTDPDREVRDEAVRTIASIGTQYSLDALAKALQDNDPQVQIDAADGIVNFYVPGYMQTGITGSIKKFGTSVKSRFTDTNDQVVDATIERDVRPEVIKALGRVARGGTSMEARAHAARALGVLRGRAAKEDLVAAVKSKDDQVIYEALIALQKIRDTSAGPQVGFLINDPKEKVQITAIETAGVLENRQAIPDLKQVLERSGSTKVQRAALSAIAMMPDPANRPLYSTYFNAPDDGLRAASAEGYARLHNRDDAAALGKAYDQERKTGPKLAQAFALVNEGHTEMTDNSPLQYLLGSLDSKQYRNTVIPYLTEAARDQQVRAALYPALSTANKEQKTGLAQVLAVSGDRDSIAPLELLSKDSDPEVAAQGLRALRVVKGRV